MPQATVTRDYRVPIPEEIRRVVPLKPGQSVRIVADDGVIKLMPDRFPARGASKLDLASSTPRTLAELAAIQGVEPAGSLEKLYGGWPEEELDDGFEKAVRRWRDEELEPNAEELCGLQLVRPGS